MVPTRVAIGAPRVVGYRGHGKEWAATAITRPVLEINEITDQVLGSAVRVHRALGPGLLESAYQACLAVEIQDRGLSVRTEVPIPVVYRGVRLKCVYRLDMVVEEIVAVELKSVSALDPVHTAQVLTYLRLAHLPVGLLINFNVRYLGKGAVRRLVLDYEGERPGARKAVRPGTVGTPDRHC